MINHGNNEGTVGIMDPKFDDRSFIYREEQENRNTISSRFLALRSLSRHELLTQDFRLSARFNHLSPNILIFRTRYPRRVLRIHVHVGCFKWQGREGEWFFRGGKNRSNAWSRIFAGKVLFSRTIIFLSFREGREFNLFIHSENFRGKKERLSRGLFLIFKKNFKCQGVLLRARVEKIACCGWCARVVRFKW